MNRRTAEVIHQAVNATFWLENPEWKSDDPLAMFGARFLQVLPFSMHALQKRVLFRGGRVLAVNGESVVVARGEEVDKFMFRYPATMSLETFGQCVAQEVATVTTYLSGIALPTSVTIKPTRIFRGSRQPMNAVAQTQQRLDLTRHPALDLSALTDEEPSLERDRTARDLEHLLRGADSLVADYGFYPDIAYSSGNLRRGVADGIVTLLDVMPIYEGGSRLIGDRPVDLVANAQRNIQRCEEFVGKFGS